MTGQRLQSYGDPTMEREIREIEDEDDRAGAALRYMHQNHERAAHVLRAALIRVMRERDTLGQMWSGESAA